MGIWSGFKGIWVQGDNLISLATKDMKRPLQLEKCKEGFPLCPVCKEEFRNVDYIISHLNKNKKEFGQIEACNSLLDNKGLKICQKLGNFLLIGEDIKNATRFNAFQLKEEEVRGWVRKKKLYDLIKKKKYEEWKGLNTKRKTRDQAVPPRLRFEILKRDNFTCQYCGKKAPDIILEVDHVEPYSLTKNNSPENLITSCKDCNRGKHTKEVV